MIKRHQVTSLVALLFVATFPTLAQHAPAQQTADSSRFLPVFVQVDELGKITKIEPANDLDPRLDTLVHKTLHEMITRPAHDAKGNAIASQLIITFSVKTAPQPGGGLKARLDYKSIKSVPGGNWHWVHKGSDIALMRRGLVMQNRHHKRTQCVDHVPIGASQHMGYYIKNGIAHTEGSPCD